MRDHKRDQEKEKQEQSEKKAFVEPKLTKHGDATKITKMPFCLPGLDCGGFFGTFNP